MPAKRFSLGLSPNVHIVSCGGNLEIRGSSREETIIEFNDTDTVINENEGAITIETDGSCVIRFPENGSVNIGDVDGSLQLKHALGSVIVASVDGSVSVRQVGPLAIGSVDGQVNIRNVNGSLTLEKAEGHVSVRDVAGEVVIAHVGGHFSGRNMAAGGRITNVDGNVALRTGVEEGTSLEFHADGNADLSIPEDANLRVIAHADGGVKANSAFEIFEDGETFSAVIGNGEATITASAGGRIRIKTTTAFDPEDDTMVDLEDFNLRLDEVFNQIDASFMSFEPALDALPHRVRSRVSRKLEAARQRVEDAQKSVSKTVVSAQRDLGDQGWGTPPADGIQRSEPIAEQERMAVLQMLEQGTITVQEAEMLISALEGKS
jgi:hypothetical protein